MLQPQKHWANVLSAAGKGFWLMQICNNAALSNVFGPWAQFSICDVYVQLLSASEAQHALRHL